MTYSTPICFYNPEIQNWWPSKLPDAILDYSLNITSSIDPTEDFAISATVAVAPSGSGEMTPINLIIETVEVSGVANTILTVTLAGGQSPRTYITKFDVSMSDNRVFSFLVFQDVPAIIPGSTIVPPPSNDFCAPFSAIGGGGNPVISYIGTITSPFEFLVNPSLGVYLDGNLSYMGPTIDYVGSATQNNLTELIIANAANYVDQGAGFELVAASMSIFEMPNMVTWIGAFSPIMSALNILSLPLLAYFNGTFAPSLAIITSISLPALVSFSGNLTPTVPALQNFSMNPALEVFNGNFEIEGAVLNQASVDGILVSLAALSGFTGRTINLSGGSSATPGASGLAAKVILLAAGNSVTTN